MRIILTILISIVTLNCLAQNKSDSVLYDKFVKVTVSDILIMLSGLDKLKDLEMYNPRSTDEQKVNSYKEIGLYVDKMRKTLVIDSVKVEPK